jgi:CheY-like chemotaxis protein
MMTKQYPPAKMEMPTIGLWVDMCFRISDANQREFQCLSISSENSAFILPELLKDWPELLFNQDTQGYLSQEFFQLTISALEDHPSPIKFFHRIGNQIWSLHKYSICNNSIHFRFTIIKNPFIQNELKIVHKESNHYQDGLKGLKILVVDDNQISVLITKKFLETFGVVVTCAENGRQAFQLCKFNSYDLILLDIHMPQLNGFQTAKLIRNTESNHSVPIIAFTTSSYYEVKNELFEAGMNEYIQKPYKTEEIQSKIFMLISATRKAV